MGYYCIFTGTRNKIIYINWAHLFFIKYWRKS